MLGGLVGYSCLAMSLGPRGGALPSYHPYVSPLVIALSLGPRGGLRLLL